jgi:hypothetical protein
MLDAAADDRGDGEESPLTENDLPPADEADADWTSLSDILPSGKWTVGPIAWKLQDPGMGPLADYSRKRIAAIVTSIVLLAFVGVLAAFVAATDSDGNDDLDMYNEISRRWNCQDAIPWSPKSKNCSYNVYWAMMHGISTHPEWYHGLTAESSFTDFQYALHKQGRAHCPRPCKRRGPACSKVTKVQVRKLGLGATDGGRCPPCAPKKLSVPDIVIPVFERDLCKLKYTVRSIVKHDPDKHLGSVHLMWVSSEPANKHLSEISEILSILRPSRETHFHDFTRQLKKTNMGGWYAQQVLKLKIAMLVNSDFYVVLDAKNAFISTVTPETFFTSCNQGRIFAQRKNYEDFGKPHSTWYGVAARVLNVCPPLTNTTSYWWPWSVSPVVFNTKTVLSLFDYIGEGTRLDEMCDGPLCYLVGYHWSVGDFTSEFALYTMFAYTQTDLRCAHVVQEDPDSRVSVTLWRGLDSGMNAYALNRVARGRHRPLVFGFQHGSFDSIFRGMHGDQDDRAVFSSAINNTIKIYLDAQLVDGHPSPEELLECVVGRLPSL